MDVPPKFLFNCMEDAKLFVTNWAKSHGYCLPVSSSKKNKNIYFSCLLSGQWKNAEDSQQCTRTLNACCPFKISASKSCAKNQTNDLWSLWTDTPPHNHTTEDLGEEHGGLLAEGKNIVAQASTMGLAPHAIAVQLSILEGKHISLRTVYNAKAAAQKEKMQGNTPMEYLLWLLEESNWVHKHKFDSKGKLNLLFFSHPGSLALAKRYHHVANVDATYKTNKNNYPLLPAVSQVATNCSFSVAFCFMCDETDASYQWAIEKLKLVLFWLGAVYLCGNWFCCCFRSVWHPDQLPKVFITNQEQALRNALKHHFPQAILNVCIWHVDKM